MKKIILILETLFLIGGYADYKYVFKDPRDVKNESTGLTTTAQNLKSDFYSDQGFSNTKYFGKTIESSIIK